jgi:hypothetical protein
METSTGIQNGLTPNKVERPACGHMQTIMARPPQNLGDYHHRLVPELQEALKTTPCEQCEKEKAEREKERMKEQAGKK